MTRAGSIARLSVVRGGHSGIASRRTLSPNTLSQRVGCHDVDLDVQKVGEGETQADLVEKTASGVKSTSTSTSDDVVSSPRATEPKTRGDAA